MIAAADSLCLSPGFSAPGKPISTHKFHLPGWRIFISSGFRFRSYETQDAPSSSGAETCPSSGVTVCLNIRGRGRIGEGSSKTDIAPHTVRIFSEPVSTLSWKGGEQHRFLLVEFSIDFIRERLDAYRSALHPLVQDILGGNLLPKVSQPMPLLDRQGQLVKAVAEGPQLPSAGALWLESKALEIAADFLFAEMRVAEPSRPKRVGAERVGRAKAILLESLVEPPTLEELGRRVGCSPYYLSRTFTKETGLTLSQWLRRARLERASELLRSGKWNVTEAALEVGYSSLSHFSEAFQEMFGCCPGSLPALRLPRACSML